MGKGGSAKVEVTYYYMSIYYGISIAVDKLLKIIIKEKTAWEGELEAQIQLDIQLRDLFGGDKKEGGAIGNVTFLPGGDTQTIPDILATRMGRANGADCVGYRGVSSLFFHREGTSSSRGFYWSANNPYLPGVWVRVLRAPKGLNPTYALIPGGAPLAAGSTVALTWKQATFEQTTNDQARMGIAFYGQDNSQIGSTTWADLIDPTPSNTFVERSLSVASPSGAIRVRVLMEMVRRTGSNNDGYIDDVAVTIGGEARTLANPGAEEGNTSGWINEVGALGVRSASPAPVSGSYYFTGGTSATTRAYQDLFFGIYDANPAHIVYECLTNTDWGMGTPATAINYDSFDDASLTLFAEGFGLSLLWTRQASIQDFVQEILDHIQAVLYVDPADGLLTLSLIRDDYDVNLLEELTPDNADLSSYQRKLWGEIVNEIVVTWTNPENEQEETVTAHDIASIAMQGGEVISDSRNYYGVRNADLAQALAWRDLRSAGQPLASCTAEVDRTLWASRPGRCVKLTWPEYGLSEIVMRIVNVEYGQPGDATIKLELIEDVYGLDVGTYESPPASEWVDPSADPEPMTPVDIVTMPLFLAARSTVSDYVDSPEHPEVVAGILATTDVSDAYEYQLWDEVTLANGDLDWQQIKANNIIGHAVLAGALAAEITSTGVSFSGLIGSTLPTVAGFVFIGDEGEAGNEIAMIDAASGTYTLVRGALDTVPRAWPAGTPVWFVDESTVWEDPTVRAAGETVDYKLLPRTSKGVLPLGSASLESAVLTERPWLPNRPANVVAAGETFTTEAMPFDVRARTDPWVTVTWAIRNRLEEDSQILAWDDVGQTPETGQTTTIEVRDFDGNLLTTHDGLAGETFDVPDASFESVPFVELRVLSKRLDDDGDFVSLQYFSHWLWVGGDPRLTEASEARHMETGERRLLED